MAEEDVYKLLLEDDDELNVNDLEIDPELEEELLSTEENFTFRRKSPRPIECNVEASPTTSKAKLDLYEVPDKETSEVEDENDEEDDKEEPRHKRSRFTLEKKPQKPARPQQQQQPRQMNQNNLRRGNWNNSRRSSSNNQFLMPLQSWNLPPQAYPQSMHFDGNNFAQNHNLFMEPQFNSTAQPMFGQQFMPLPLMDIHSQQSRLNYHQTIPLMDAFPRNSMPLMGQLNYIGNNDYAPRDHHYQAIPLLQTPNHHQQPKFPTLNRNLLVPNLMNPSIHQHQQSQPSRPPMHDNARYQLRPINSASQSNPVLRPVPLVHQNRPSLLPTNRPSLKPQNAAPPRAPSLKLTPLLTPTPLTRLPVSPANSIPRRESLKWTNSNTEPAKPIAKTAAPSPKTTPVKPIEEKKVEIEQIKNELGIDEEYMKKLEEQKRLREQIAQQKTNKRKLFASICNKSATGQLPIKANATSPAKPTNSTQSTVASIQLKANTSTNTNVKVESSAKPKPSSTVAITGLGANIRESSIRKLCRPYGMVVSTEFSNDADGLKRTAMVKFADMSQAQKLVNEAGPKTMVDDCLLTIQFSNWAFDDS